MEEHQSYMALAIEEAEKAYQLGEVPIGAIIVYQGKILATGYNQKELTHDSTAHAEILVIREVSNALKAWRLTGCTLYVTLEPCPMCAGAIIQSRISTVVYGAPNKIYGSLGTILPLHNYYPDAKNLEIIPGILQEECAQLMKSFFRREVPKLKS